MSEQTSGGSVTVVKAADVSPCGTYRYSLERWWDPSLPPLVWVMLNPSTADHEVDDPTIRRCIGFTRRDNTYGGLVVVNLYALRATNPADLRRHADPIGPENDIVLSDYGMPGFHLVAAWGVHAPQRAAQVLSGPLRHQHVLCLGKTKQGHPRHPLYVRGDQPFEVFRAGL